MRFEGTRLELDRLLGEGAGVDLASPVSIGGQPRGGLPSPHLRNARFEQRYLVEVNPATPTQPRTTAEGAVTRRQAKIRARQCCGHCVRMDDRAGTVTATHV